MASTFLISLEPLRIINRKQIKYKEFPQHKQKFYNLNTVWMSSLRGDSSNSDHLQFFEQLIPVVFRLIQENGKGDEHFALREVPSVTVDTGESTAF